MGPIGVGKSTLIQEAHATPGVTGWPEVLSPLFKDYCSLDRNKYAMEFQMSMMHGARVRTENALAVLEKMDPSVPATIALERPISENIVFARANYEHGDLSMADFTRYWTYFCEDMDKYWKRMCGTNVTSVLLWAFEQQTLQRMKDRDRLGEDKYDMLYMRRVFSNYFREYITSGLGRRVPEAIVVDWSTFQSWEALVSFLNTSPSRPQFKCGGQDTPLPHGFYPEGVSWQEEEDGRTHVIIDMERYLQKELSDSAVELRDHFFFLAATGRLSRVSIV